MYLLLTVTKVKLNSLTGNQHIKFVKFTVTAFDSNSTDEMSFSEGSNSKQLLKDCKCCKICQKIIVLPDFVSQVVLGTLQYFLKSVRDWFSVLYFLLLKI